MLLKDRIDRDSERHCIVLRFIPNFTFSLGMRVFKGEIIDLLPHTRPVSLGDRPSSALIITATSVDVDTVVNLSTRNDPFVLGGTSFEAAITFMHPAWAGVESRYLFRSGLIPVCSPDLVAPSRRDSSTALSTLPLLHKLATPESWPDYAREFEIDLRGAATGGRFEQFSMLIEAARAGLGVALVPYLYVADAVSAGQLVPLGPPGRDTGKDFILVTRAQSHQTELLEEFADWLIAEAALGAPPFASEGSISPRL